MLLELELQHFYLKRHLENNTTMRKIILLLAILFVNLQSIKSQCVKIGDVNKKNFPSIEFTIQNKNPEILSDNQFKVFDYKGNKELKLDEIQVDHIIDDKTYTNENKCVYILLETLYNRKTQNKNVSGALSNSFSNINSGDLVKISSFDLRREGNIILQDINSEFTDDKNYLSNKVDNFRVKRDFYSQKSVSDVYGALLEAIKELSKLDTDLPKSIVLISEESVNDKPNQTATEVIKLAKDKGIIIHSIKYNQRNFGQYEIPSLSEETYGLRLKLDRNSSSQIKKNIISFMDNMFNTTVKRSKGQKYTIRAKLSESIRDGKDNKVLVLVNDETRLKIPFNNSGNWIIAQFQLHLIIAIIATILFLSLCLILVLFLIDKYKKKKLKEQSVINEMQQLDSQHQQELTSQRQELENLKQEEKQKLQLEQNLKMEAIRSEDVLQLINEMRSNGSLPILKVLNSGKESQHEINIPNFTVGREEASNSLGVMNSNISRNHFSIVYTNSVYTIKDNNSTNGIIVNGYKVKDTILNNSDIIQIADVTFTFYK